MLFAEKPDGSVIVALPASAISASEDSPDSQSEEKEIELQSISPDTSLAV